jgi:aspartyl protease family protein
MRYLLYFCASLFVLIGLTGKLAQWVGYAPGATAKNTHVAASAAPEGAAAKPSRRGNDVMFVARDRGGHFSVDAVIGGHRIPFLIDTGASIVALTSQSAARLHITPAMKGRPRRMQTANGVVAADSVRLASIQIGSLEVQDVEAVIMPSNRLGQNLLGMSFLSRLSRYEFRSGSLVMEQ